MTGLAVKVTFVPEHIVEALALMDTEGVTDEFTVMVTVFEVAVVGEAQLTLEVMIQLIASPFTRALEVYVAPLPAFDPLSSH